MAATLDQAITENGMNQGDLVKLLNNLILAVNELITDHATNKTAVDELNLLTDELRADHATFITEQTAIGTTLADYKAIYDAHTHTADGNASRTSLPDTGSQTGSPSAASAFTDTSGSPPATISAAEATAGPAALTNNATLVTTA